MPPHALPAVPPRPSASAATAGAATPAVPSAADLARLARQVFRITHVDIRQYRADLLAWVLRDPQAQPAAACPSRSADDDAGPGSPTHDQAWALIADLEAAAWRQALPEPPASPPGMPPTPAPADAGALVWLPACPDDGLAQRLRAGLQPAWPGSTWLVTRADAWPAASPPADGWLRRSHSALHDPPPAGCRVVIAHGLLAGVADHVRRRLLLQLATAMAPLGLLWLPDSVAPIARALGWRPARPMSPGQAWLHPPSASVPGRLPDRSRDRLPASAPAHAQPLLSGPPRPAAPSPLPPQPARLPATARPDLLRAMHRGELLLHYQPQYALATGRLCGIEALLRWQHPVHGLVGPVPLVRQAEAQGGIHALGLWVLAEACRQLARWQADGLAVDRIAVNVSALQWLRPRFVDEVLATLDEAGLRPAQLVLELTESCPWPSTPGPAQALARCRAEGIGLSLDDFGTGHAGLQALQQLPLTQLKVDAGLLAGATGDPRGLRPIDQGLALARERGLELVVEGLQQAEQLATVRRLGAQAYQGHLGAAAQDPRLVPALLHAPAAQGRGLAPPGAVGGPGPAAAPPG